MLVTFPFMDSSLIVVLQLNEAMSHAMQGPKMMGHSEEF